MGKPPFVLWIIVCLWSFVSAEWQSSGYITCEAKYGYQSCLLSKDCLLKFLDCRCIPAEVKHILSESSSLDERSLCLYCTYVMKIGEPLCCSYHKRSIGTRIQFPLLLSLSHSADEPFVIRRDFKRKRITPASYNKQLAEIIFRDEEA